MITLDELLIEWKTDAVIDEIELDKSSIEIAVLHSKYLDYMQFFKKDLRRLGRIKKSFTAVDRRNNTDYKITDEQFSETEDAIEACEKILYSINQRSFNIKNIIQWRQFTQGADI